MKAHDESAWELQRAELVADGEIGKDFLEFLEAWMAETERLVEANEFHLAPCLRYAFTTTEQKLDRRIGSAFVGQMLVVICTYWELGDELSKVLSPIELRLTQDALALKIAELEASAAEPEETSDAG